LIFHPHFWLPVVRLSTKFLLTLFLYLYFDPPSLPSMKLVYIEDGAFMPRNQPQPLLGRVAHNPYPSSEFSTFFLLMCPSRIVMYALYAGKVLLIFFSFPVPSAGASPQVSNVFYSRRLFFYLKDSRSFFFPIFQTDFYPPTPSPPPAT